jgi:Putative zinc-finger
MTMPVKCEDKDAIVAYLYDEVDAVERARIEAHLTGCSACRGEVNALRAVRVELPAWVPPERDLGFTIVDRARAAAPARRWIVPAWGLAAAATLVLATAAAIANLEVTYGADGFRVRAGWSRGQDRAVAESRGRPAQTAPGTRDEWRAELTSLERRLRTEFGTNETRAVSSAPASESADVLRRVRTLIDESETRQQRQLALRLAEVLRDFDRQRQTDLVRIQYGLGQLERSTAADRQMVNHLVRVSSQR